uniref:hypothetical protein n=1 Tax=Phocaeicola sp. TaxID=2773926 RepID=UPI003FF0789B
MGLFGSIAGGVLGAAGSIFGGVKASKAMKRMKRNLEEQKRENQAWFDRRYNENATQRADAQQAISLMREEMKKRSQAAAGAQAVMGGTEESVAAAKAANNQALADATAQIAVNGERRKDAVEQQYQQRDAQLDDALNNLEVGKAQAIGQAVQGVAQAAGNLIGI